MKKFVKALVLLSIIALVLTACGQAEPENAWEAVKDEGKIVVGTSADYEPWEYKDADDNFVGIDMEIMLEIGKRLGVEVEFQDLGFDTLVAAVETGKIDAVIAAMAATEERREKVDFTVVYYAGDNVVITTADSGIAFDDPLKMADYKVGTQSGTIMYYWVEDNLITPGLMSSDNLFLYERNEQVSLDLKAGRLDLAIMDLEPGKQYMADEEFGFVEVWRGPMDPNGQAIAIMKGETELKAEIDKVLSAMIEDGFIKNLLDSYDVE